MMTGYEIRPLDDGDAPRLAAVHVAVWKNTYPGLVDQVKLDGLTAADRIPGWTAIVAQRDDAQSRGIRTRCAVDVAGGEIIAMATGGPARDADAPVGTQLWSLNVLPGHHGQGVASRLLDAVVDPGTPAYLWVAAGNGRAIAFYRKHGFDLDGAARHDAEWDCHELRMRRPV